MSGRTVRVAEGLAFAFQTLRAPSTLGAPSIPRSVRNGWDAKPRFENLESGHDFSRADNANEKDRALAPANLHLRQTDVAGLRYLNGIKLLAVLMAICSALCLRAQSPPTPHSLAHRIDNHYNQLHSLRAAFTESYNGLGVRRAENGTLTLLKPGRMRWDYSSPAGKIFLLDGKFAWFYARGDAQVQRISSRDLDDLRSPLRFLLGHTELEKELANLSIAPAPNGQFTLTGQPKGPGNDPDKRVLRLALTVTADGTITAIEIEETDGALTRFTFSDESDNPAVPPAQFHFTPPAGIPVVDATAPV